MILDTIRRWLALALAFCFCAFVSIVILFALGALWTGDELRTAAERGGDPFLRDVSGVFGALFFTSAVLPAMTALPGFLAVLVGEMFHIRSALYYTLAGGLAVAAIPVLAPATQAAGQAAAVPGAYLAIFATAGFAGGFLYWLLVGRKA